MTASEFKNLVLPAYDAMLRVASRVSGTNVPAGDMVQDVMQHLWEKHETLDVKTVTVPFLFKCVRNRCIDYLRCHTPMADESELQSVSNDGYEADDEQAERLTLVIKAIERLEEPRRSVMRHSLDGKSVEEISQAMKMTQVNVRQILSRSRRQIRTLILNN